MTTLIISLKFLKKLFFFAGDKDVEVCGVLIGKKIDKKKFKITNIVYDDNPIDPTSFGVTRNTENVYIYVKEIVENSYEDVDYIGEWHSHLFGKCDFSSLDVESIRYIMEDQDYQKPNYLILLIIKFPSQSSAFLFEKKQKFITEMVLKIED